MSVETALADMCETCRDKVLALFAMDPRPGPEIIAGDRLTMDCCFIADEIVFNDGGRLIFIPDKKREYCPHYFAVCRKLTIIEGGEPLPFDICNTENPGNAYKGKNVITWQDRLVPAAAGAAPNPDTVADAPDFGAWQDQGQGNDGLDGPDGGNGASGAAGAAGRSAPHFTLVCLEVEFIGLTAYLTIDFDGQVGGTGGRGQHGGKGGDGMKGRISESDNTWPGKGCDREAGDGGDGGDHGDGGMGGKGGAGGNAGKIIVVSAQSNIVAGGAFLSGKVGYVNDGGNEGAGGQGGFGEPTTVAGLARGGRGGIGGTQCSGGNDGADGAPGFPPRVPLQQGSDLNAGPDGAAGAGNAIEIYKIIPDDCTDPIPLQPKLITVDPVEVCRGFSAAENNIPVTINGEHLAQVVDVGFSLAGVSATILPTSTDTELNLLVDLTATSGVGPCDIILTPDFGLPETIPGAITISRFEVLGVLPASGPRGNIIEVTISGTCFDPGALVQNVSVSGVGVSVADIIVLDANTLTCEFDIGLAAAPTARDITVQMGTRSHTLAGGFTVTL